MGGARGKKRSPITCREKKKKKKGGGIAQARGACALRPVARALDPHACAVFPPSASLAFPQHQDPNVGNLALAPVVSVPLFGGEVLHSAPHALPLRARASFEGEQRSRTLF